MATRYAIAVFEGPTQIVSLAGTFSSLESAQVELDRFEKLEDRLVENIWWGLSAHIVTIESGSEIRKRLKEYLK